MSWWPITKTGSLKLVLRLKTPRKTCEIKSKKSEQRYLQLFMNKFCLYIEIAKINKIETEIGIANNLWVSNIKHCLLKDKQRCADQVDESLTPIKDWTRVKIRGKDNNIFHQINDLLTSLFSRFWLIVIVVIRSKKAVKRWAVTEYELSKLITVNAPIEPWTITKKTNNE